MRQLSLAFGNKGKIGYGSIRAVFYFLMFAQLACSPSSDSQMSSRFVPRAEQFQRVADTIGMAIQNHELPSEFIVRRGDFSHLGLAPAIVARYDRLLDIACENCDLISTGNPSMLLFTVEARGVIFHEIYSGYAYSTIKPMKEDPSLDYLRNQVTGDCSFHFKHLRDKWYLYVQTCQ